MNIKMIVLDLDKTLLRSDKTISEYTVEILKRCKQNGIKIAIASARPKRAVKIFADRIGCDNVICLNGAMIAVNEKIIASNKIDNTTAHELILKILDKIQTAKLSTEINDSIYANFDLKDIFTSKEDFISTDFKKLHDDVDKIIFSIESENDANEIMTMLPDNFHCISKPEDLFELVRIEDINRIDSKFNVERINLIATDGATNYMRDLIDNMDDRTFEIYLKYHFATCERQDLIGATHHSLDILKKL